MRQVGEEGPLGKIARGTPPPQRRGGIASGGASEHIDDDGHHAGAQVDRVADAGAAGQHAHGIDGGDGLADDEGAGGGVVVGDDGAQQQAGGRWLLHGKGGEALDQCEKLGASHDGFFEVVLAAGPGVGGRPGDQGTDRCKDPGEGGLVEPFLAGKMIQQLRAGDACSSGDVGQGGAVETQRCERFDRGVDHAGGGGGGGRVELGTSHIAIFY